MIGKKIEIGEPIYDPLKSSFSIVVDFVDYDSETINELELHLPKTAWYFEITNCNPLDNKEKEKIKSDIKRYAEKHKVDYEKNWQEDKLKIVTLEVDDLQEK